MCNKDSKSVSKTKRQKLICPICEKEMLKNIGKSDKAYLVKDSPFPICNICFIMLVAKYNTRLYRKSGKNGTEVCAYDPLYLLNSQISESTEVQKSLESIKYEENSKSNKSGLKDIISKVKSVVKGQDEHVDEICSAIYKNLTCEEPEIKSNILLLGPTGNGKSQIVEMVASEFGVPYVKEDATIYTQTGYKGEYVQNIILNLLIAAGGDIELAQHGIIILDEVDKKRSKYTSEIDISGEGVLDSLLKILEGTDIIIKDEKNGIEARINTSMITMVFVGAFPDMVKIREDRLKVKGSMGFSNEAKKEVIKEKIDLEYTVADFEKFGFKPEFIGRFDTIVEINKLKYEDYIDIIENSEKSILLSYVNLLSQNGVTVSFDQEVINEIAKKAVELDIGARGLKRIVRKMFDKIMYKFMLGENEYTRCVITKETVIDPNNFKFQ